MIETQGTSLKKSTVASRQHPPPYGCTYSGYTMCSEILGVETSIIQSRLGAIELSLVWTHKHLQGQKFADDNEVMEAVQSWLKATLKSFFLQGICKLVDRWTKCVAK
jgi:hypothetical protein